MSKSFWKKDLRQSSLYKMVPRISLAHDVRKEK